MTKEYKDIINFPRHISRKHYTMSNVDRAAQFSPFAALNGHDEAVKETARLTEKRIELDEYVKEALNDRIQVLVWELGNHPIVKITYFQPDQNKDGGAYITIEGSIKKIDEYERLIYMEDDTSIPVGEVISIEGKVFSKYF